jgi:hypothetical protein
VPSFSVDVKRTGDALVVALLVVALLVAAGCGGGGDDAEGDEAGRGPETMARDATGSGAEGSGGGDAETSGEGAESAACELLTLDEVSDLFGNPAAVVPAEADKPVVGGSASCLWESTVDGDMPTIYQLQLSVFDGSEFFDPESWGGTPETIDDLGDEAFVVRSGGLLGSTAGFIEGDRSVFLSYSILLGEGAPEPGEQSDELVEMLRTVEDRL